MEIYYQKTIDLVQPTKGQTIIDALKSMISKDYKFVYTFHPGKDKRLKVGFESCKPYYCLGILTGENLDKFEVQANKDYKEIALGTAPWRVYGSCSSTYNSQETTEKEVEKLAEDLEQKILNLTLK